MKRNSLILAIGTLLLVIFVLPLFMFQVRTTEVAVVTTFGHFSRIAGAGPHFRWGPAQSVYKFDQRIHTYDSKLEQVLTRDGFSLLIQVYVGWNISDAETFLKRFSSDPETGVEKAQDNLEGLIRNAYSGVVGNHTFPHFVSTDPKELKFVEIEQEMQTRIQADCRAQTNGLNIAFLGIKRIGLPESVTKEVFSRMESERDVLVSSIRGEGERLASEIRSKADSDSARLLAEADAQALKIQGEGEKEAAQSFEVFKQEPELAILLLKYKALEQLLQSRATLILDDKISPIDLMKEQKSAGAKK
jgi:membrane protease subunit HflC